MLIHLHNFLCLFYSAMAELSSCIESLCPRKAKIFFISPFTEKDLPTTALKLFVHKWPSSSPFVFAWLILLLCFFFFYLPIGKNFQAYKWENWDRRSSMTHLLQFSKPPCWLGLVCYLASDSSLGIPGVRV